MAGAKQHRVVWFWTAEAPRGPACLQGPLLAPSLHAEASPVDQKEAAESRMRVQRVTYQPQPLGSECGLGASVQQRSLMFSCTGTAGQGATCKVSCKAGAGVCNRCRLLACRVLARATLVLMGRTQVSHETSVSPHEAWRGAFWPLPTGREQQA